MANLRNSRFFRPNPWCNPKTIRICRPRLRVVPTAPIKHPKLTRSWPWGGIRPVWHRGGAFHRPTRRLFRAQAVMAATAKSVRPWRQKTTLIANANRSFHGPSSPRMNTTAPINGSRWIPTAGWPAIAKPERAPPRHRLRAVNDPVFGSLFAELRSQSCHDRLKLTNGSVGSI